MRDIAGAELLRFTARGLVTAGLISESDGDRLAVGDRGLLDVLRLVLVLRATPGGMSVHTGRARYRILLTPSIDLALALDPGTDPAEVDEWLAKLPRRLGHGSAART